jgi:hypothetical protein
VDVPALFAMSPDIRTPYATSLAPLGAGEAQIFPGVVLLILALAGACCSAAGQSATRTRVQKALLIASAGCLILACLALPSWSPDVMKRLITLASPLVLAASLATAWAVVAAFGPGVSPVRRAALLGVVLVVGGLTLGLGPRVTVFGQDLGSGLFRPDLLGVPLPLRAPARFVLASTIGMALLAAVAVSLVPVRRRAMQYAVSAAALAALTIDVHVAPYEYEQVPRPAPAYRWLAASDTPGAVVEYPPNRWAVYQALVADRRTVNGLGYAYPPTHPSAIRRPNLTPGQLDVLWREYHPRFLVLRLGNYPHEERAQLLRSAESLSGALTLLARFGLDYVYELKDRGAGNLLIREWPREFLESERTAQLSFAGSISAVPDEAIPVLSLLWNDRILRREMLPGGRFSEAIALGGLPLRSGQNRLEIRADYLRSREARPYPVGVTGLALSVDVTVAAGRDESWIQVNGHDVQGSKGYTLVTLDPADHHVTGVGRFNTSWDEAASEAMAGFIDRVPPGVPVLVTTQYDTSRWLTARGVDALQSLGLSTDLRDRFGWAHAAIGVKGAPPGTGEERANEVSAVVTLGKVFTPSVRLDDLGLRNSDGAPTSSISGPRVASGS